MAKRTFKALLEWDAEEQVWVTTVPALGGLSTYGETREDAIEQTRDAILGYMEAMKREGLPVPADGAELELVDVEVAVA